VSCPISVKEVTVTDHIAAAIARLESASGLGSILDAACDGFEQMLPVIEDQQDPASGAFTAFVMAGAYAANGRDALLFAPSLPRLSGAQASGPGKDWQALEAALALTRLSQVLAQRLGAAAGVAGDVADRRACVRGRREADRLARLLRGVTGM
jgi:hypothetical protein